MAEYRELKSELREAERSLALVLRDIETGNVKYPSREVNQRFNKLQKRIEVLYEKMEPLKHNMLSLTGLKDLEKYDERLVMQEQKEEIEKSLVERKIPEEIRRLVMYA